MVKEMRDTSDSKSHAKEHRDSKSIIYTESLICWYEAFRKSHDSSSSWAIGIDDKRSLTLDNFLYLINGE